MPGCLTGLFMTQGGYTERMPNEKAVDPDPVEENAGQGRANISTPAYLTAVLTSISGGTPAAGSLTGPQTLAVYTTNPGVGPGTTGAFPAAARPAITWGGVTNVGGAATSGATAAQIVSNAVQVVNVPPGTYTHYGVFNAAGTFLYGKALTPNVTVPVGATGTITVTVTHTYDIN
jgi:hypothetical protein